MASISSVVWFIIGLVVVLYSKFVMSMTDKNLKVFVYVGLAFIIIGVFKFVVGFVLNRSKFKAKLSGSDSVVSEKTSSYKVVICPICGAKNYSFFNYCHSCGNKLK